MEFLTLSAEVFREGLSEPRDQIMRNQPWEGLGEKHSSQNQPQYKGPERGRTEWSVYLDTVAQDEVRGWGGGHVGMTQGLIDTVRSGRSWGCYCSAAQSFLTLCDPLDCSTPGFPVLHHPPELAQTHVRRVSDAIQPSHPLSSPSPSFNLSLHQGLIQ